MILLYLLALLRWEFHNKDIDEISWTSLECRVARDMHVRRELVTALRVHFLENGDLLERKESMIPDIIEEEEQVRNRRGQKITVEMQSAINTYMIDLHNEGTTVMARKVQSYLRNEHNMECHRTTISRVINYLGLS